MKCLSRCESTLAEQFVKYLLFSSVDLHKSNNIAGIPIRGIPITVFNLMSVKGEAYDCSAMPKFLCFT